MTTKKDAGSQGDTPRKESETTKIFQSGTFAPVEVEEEEGETGLIRSWWNGFMAKKRLAIALGFVVFSGLATAITIPDAVTVYTPLSRKDIGRKAAMTIRAVRDFTFVPDEELLRKEREEAASKVLMVYRYTPRAWLSLWRHNIRYAFRAMADPLVDRVPEEEAYRRFVSLLGIDIPIQDFTALKNAGFPRIKRALRILFDSMLGDRYLVRSLKTFRKKHPRGIQLLVVGPDGTILEQKVLKGNYERFIDLPMLEPLVISEVESRFAEEESVGLPEDARSALVELFMALVTKYLDDTSTPGVLPLGLVYDEKATRKSRQEAAARVTVTALRFRRGDIIVKAGERITLKVYKIYNAMLPPLETRGIRFFGYWFLVAAFLVVLGWFSTLKFGGRRGTVQDFYIMGLYFLVLLLIVRGGRELIFTGGAKDPLLVAFLLPVTSGGLLVNVLIGTRLAVFFVMALSVLSTWALGGSIEAFLYLFTAGLAATGTATRIESRFVVFRASVVLILMGLLYLLAHMAIAGMVGDWKETVKMSVALLVGAFIMGSLFSGILPLMEWMGGYLTDIKLLELMDTESELLQKLKEKAPGTFNHSRRVGELAAFAAERVGANPKLVKVAGYYHDVGKMLRPEYFAENQQEGQPNPHDSLSPSMSAKILRSHVKDTKALLQKAGLPPKVIEVAASHHGTSLMGYFYQKAKAQAEEEYQAALEEYEQKVNNGVKDARKPKLEEVREEEFRYPGPKPQSKEAGILMLADSCEAAITSLERAAAKDPSRRFDRDAIRQKVREIIKAKLADGQLDETGLTLRDLTEIERAFVEMLVSDRQQNRPLYPGEKQDGRKRTSPPQKSGGQNQKGEGKKVGAKDGKGGSGKN